MVDRPSIEELPPDQKKVLDQMKVEIEKLNLDEESRSFCDDFCLCRYLRARNFVLEKSLDMLKGTIEWRKSFQPHKITYQQVEPQAKARSNYVHGKDKSGHPTVYMRVSRDPSGTPEEKLRMIVWVLEEAIRQMDSSKGVEKLVYFIDLNDFSMLNSSRDTKVGSTWANILQNHYPERCFRIILVDAPSIFTAFYKIISPFVDPNTKSKVRFINGSKRKKREVLLEYYNPEDLEEEYGGDLPENK